MISIIAALACSEYGFAPLKQKEYDPPTPAPDTGIVTPPVVTEENTEDTSPPDVPQDTGYIPPADTGDAPVGDSIPTTQEYLIDLCVNHVTPDHCPLDPNMDEIEECREDITYDPAAVDAFKASTAGLTIFAMMYTAPEDPSNILISYLHLSEGDNREVVMAEFNKDSEDGGYPGDMSQERYVDVPHIDCFSHFTPLNRNRIDLDPSAEFGDGGYGYNEARLIWNYSLGDYQWAYVGFMTTDWDDYHIYDTEDGYFIYGTQLMVDNNNGDLNSLVKMLTADAGVVPETWTTNSQWTNIYYVTP